MRDCIVLTVVVAVEVLMVSSSRAAEPTPLERFEREAPVAWAKLLALASCIEGECSRTTTDHLTGKAECRPAFQFQINGLSGRTPLAPNRLECVNDDYEFVIDDLGGEKWEVKQLLWKEPKGKQIAAGKIYYDEHDGTVGPSPWQVGLANACRGLFIQANWLPPLVALRTFQVTEAQYVRNGRELVRIKFTNAAIRDVGLTIESGEIMLDPARYWQIVDARINGHEIVHRESAKGPKEYDVLFTIKNEYEMADGKLPYARRQMLRTQISTLVDRENVYITNLSLGDRNDFKPFRLPAFGLAEPEKGQNVGD